MLIQNKINFAISKIIHSFATNKIKKIDNKLKINKL